MTTSLDVYEPGRDDAEIIRLRAAVWGAEHPYNTPAYFHWLFQANPAGRGTGAIMRRDGRLVGFLGLATRKLSLAGTMVPVAQALDYMVDPGVRGGLAGVYGFRLVEEWTRLAIRGGYSFGIGFPNANSSRLVTSPKLGWLPVFSPVLLVRPLGGMRQPKTPVGRLPGPLVAIGLNSLAGWSVLSQSIRRKAPGHRVPIDRFGAEFDELRTELEAPNAIGNWRDSAYLNWRYADHPLNVYDRFGWYTDGRLRGFIVTIERELFGVKATLIVDLAVAGGSANVEFALIREAQRGARRAGSSLMVTLAIGNSSTYHRLRRFGFHAVPKRFDPKPFLLTALALGSGAESLTTPAAWRFNWADMDVV